MADDELERMAAAGLITAGQADGARRVDDDIAPTALGKLVCIGADARALLPGYAQLFGLAVAGDTVFSRTTRPPLPDDVVDVLAAQLAVATWAPDGTCEVVVAAASAVPHLAALPLPPHRVVVGDEPRVAGLLDRVHEGQPPALPEAREDTAPTTKSERFLARPVREIDRRPKPPEPSALSVVPMHDAPLETAPREPRETSDAALRPRETSGPTRRAEVTASGATSRPRGPRRAALVGGALALVVLCGVAVVVVRGPGEAATPASAHDARAVALDEARAKERAGEMAWAIAAYSRAIADPRRDDERANALLGRARCQIALGDREAALRDIDAVTKSTFASAGMKSKAEALRASMR